MISIVRFSEHSTEDWEKFHDSLDLNIFLMRRRFLDHHKSRFVDFSVLITDETRVIGLVAACVSPVHKGCITCHAGLSYGGILFSPGIELELTCDCVASIEEFYKGKGFQEINIKLIPSIYSNGRLDFVDYCLIRNNFNLDAIEVSSTIDLKKPFVYSNMRTRRIKRGLKKNISVVNDWSYCAEFWSILNDNLRQRYGTAPVHSLREINYLKEKFIEEIQLYVAISDGKLLAGSVFFDTALVRHLQYGATNDLGRQLSANDLVVHCAIEEARVQGFSYFDFGISTENKGDVINHGLLDYKSSFGSQLTFNKSYVKKI